MDKFYIHTPTGQIIEMDGEVLKSVLQTAWGSICDGQAMTSVEAKTVNQIAEVWRVYPELM